MPCEKCEAKLSRLVTPDVKEGNAFRDTFCGKRLFGFQAKLPIRSGARASKGATGLREICAFWLPAGSKRIVGVNKLIEKNTKKDK